MVSSRSLPADDMTLVRSLRDGDEATFAGLVDAWGAAMLRMALVHVSSRAVAEEVVQESWLTVLRDLDRYEGRSSLRTWVLGIVINVARSRGRAERRCTPTDEALDAAGPLCAGSRFRHSAMNGRATGRSVRSLGGRRSRSCSPERPDA